MEHVKHCMVNGPPEKGEDRRGSQVTNEPNWNSKSVAVDAEVYQEVCRLAEEAGTTKGAVLSAIARLGLPYYQNRWREFLKMYPELGRNGRAVPYTQDRPTVPLR